LFIPPQPLIWTMRSPWNSEAKEAQFSTPRRSYVRCRAHCWTAQIPDELIKCVGFVSLLADVLEFGGTPFIVGVKADATRSHAHLVTAKHVAEAIDPGEAVIAMNGKDGMPLYMRSGEARVDRRQLGEKLIDDPYLHPGLAPL
jgi:hypothetical protein